MKMLKVSLILVVLAGASGLALIYSGVYPIGADVHHSRLTHWALEALRERSIATHIRGIEVPPLDDPDLLLQGGADYNEMCTGCHMRPGVHASEISAGLYPHPPNLAMGETGGKRGDAASSAARQFWIIKHGIKASGMAAFGLTHDDARIWAMVAFLQKLPNLTLPQYQILTAGTPGEHGHGDHMEMDTDEADEPADVPTGSSPAKHLHSE